MLVSSSRVSRGCRFVWSAALHRCRVDVSSTARGTQRRNLCSRPPPTDHFQVFKLRHNFEIDVTELSKTFHLLQIASHPDKFVNQNKSERDETSELSAAINVAYGVLRNPLKRSLHLLELAGFPLEEGSKEVDTEFLAEVMEINERLADVESDVELDQIKTKNNEILHRLYESVAEAFREKDYALARRIVSRIKYYANVDAKVRNYERDRNIL